MLGAFMTTDICGAKVLCITKWDFYGLGTVVMLLTSLMVSKRIWCAVNCIRLVGTHALLDFYSYYHW